MTAKNCIETKDLVKTFAGGKTTAVDHLSLTIEKGQTVGLIGADGAGKTTLMRVICGYLAPDAGSVRICGLSYENDRAGILRQLGYMPENTPLYQEMTVFEYLRFVAGVFKMTEREFAAGVKETAVGLGIEPVLGEKIKNLSKGYRRRAGIVSALLHRPRLAVLDEPTEGLDPNQKIVVRRFLKDYAKDNLVLISTHLLEEAEALKSRVLLLSEGKIRLDAPVESLRSCSADGTLADAFARLTAGAEENAADERKGKIC